MFHCRYGEEASFVYMVVCDGVAVAEIEPLTEMYSVLFSAYYQIYWCGKRSARQQPYFMKKDTVKALNFAIVKITLVLSIQVHPLIN